MKGKYDISVVSFDEIHELPDSWTSEDFKGILEAADFDDWDQIADAELKEYAIMSLQEFKPDEAAEIALTYKLGARLSKGQIENLAHEMIDEKLWEEYTDLRLHKQLYDCAVLLKWAFPKKFPESDAVKCVIEVQTSGLKAPIIPSKVLITRWLANGMDDHAILNRLFDDQIGGQPFPEAEGIIWKFDVIQESDKLILTIYSSTYWLQSMEDVDRYTAHVDSD